MATNPDPTQNSSGHRSPGQGASPTGTPSRRRFVGATAGSVGVLLAVHAKSTLGAVTCLSPSAMVSGNLSHQPSTAPCSGGLSPTAWKLQANLSLWSSGSVGATPPSFNTALADSLGCNSGHDISDPKSVMSSLGTLVETILPGAVANTGIWEILAFPGLFALTVPTGELMSHLIAAWLNAGLHADYPIKHWHVSEMWSAMTGSGVYCPSSVTCSSSSGMTESELIAYIKNTFVVTSDLITVCTVNGTSSSSQGSTKPKK